MARPTDAFVDLLNVTQEYLRRYVAGQIFDTETSTSKPRIDQRERAIHALAFGCAMRAREDLFAMGRSHGLTDREITVALLRPVVHALRPTLTTVGCSCPRCRRHLVSA